VIQVRLGEQMILDGKTWSENEARAHYTMIRG
jgi:hypothetical protein